jgi:hypothetical protein
VREKEEPRRARPRLGGQAGGGALGGEVRALSVAVGKKEGTNRFLCNQWEWWVIYPNSTKLGFSLRYSTKNMELGLAPPFFGADSLWSCWSWLCLADNFWSGIVFLDLELRGALPNTPMSYAQ